MISILGQNIKRIRTSKNITQQQLSLLSNVSQSTIAEIERGTRQNLRADNLSKISSALNVSTNELLGVSEDGEYEITDVESASSIIFKRDSDLELDSVPLSDFELDLIKAQLSLAFTIIRMHRDNKS